MRPFHIPTRKTWVDLDTIQSIDEPKFLNIMGSGGLFIELSWQHAFRDTSDRALWEVDWVSDRSKEFQPIPDGWKPMPDDHGRGIYIEQEGDEPAKLASIRREVFVPFWEAWTGRRYV